MTVIVTDAHYRSSLAAVRALAKRGHSVILTQTARDAGKLIPAFKSKYASRTVLFDCSVTDADAYKSALVSLASEYERPVLFPIGAKTTALIAQNREELLKVCDFTVTDADTLALANDKSKVRVAAQNAGIPVPQTYEDGEVPSDYPVIIKPKCGEAFGLKASERYIIVHSADKYKQAYAEMEKYGGAPVVQKLVSGDGIGVSLLMSTDGCAVSAICHKRVREYSVSGGPSACCESFYDETLVRASERLLASIGFSGMAMVEYKGGHLLEINPRIWGSFPLTYAAGASFADDYVRLSRRECVHHELDNYERGVKMSFVFNDLAACVGLLRHGRVRDALSGIGDILFRRVRDGVYDKEDPKPFWCYVRSKILRK
ncbi:MAG: ATP-grasp domain-containing protein [Clostridia bacterium]|nr:ATP-grasp domain-containing protein [Clostridia bacterium]